MAGSRSLPGSRELPPRISREDSSEALVRQRYWSPEMEALARRTMRQANGYAWMYERMAFSAKRWGDALNIISGALGGIVGTAGLVSIFTDDGDSSSDDGGTPLWARIVEVIIGYLIGVISILSATWHPSESQMNDVLTQVSYATMGRDMMYQLAQPRRDRSDAREYMKTKLGEIEQLKISAPVIDTRARNAYNRKFKNNPIYTPEDEWSATMADARAVQDALRESEYSEHSDYSEFSEHNRFSVYSEYSEYSGRSGHSEYSGRSGHSEQSEQSGTSESWGEPAVRKRDKRRVAPSRGAAAIDDLVHAYLSSSQKELP